MEGALNLLAVKIFSLMIIGIDSRPQKPSENKVAQRFSTRCFGEQNGRSEKTQNQDAHESFAKRDIPSL